MIIRSYTERHWSMTNRTECHWSMNDRQEATKWDR